MARGFRYLLRFFDQGRRHRGQGGNRTLDSALRKRVLSSTELQTLQEKVPFGRLQGTGPKGIDPIWSGRRLPTAITHFQPIDGFDVIGRS